MKRSTLTLTGLLALSLAVPSAFAGEPVPATPDAKPKPASGEVPYGHRDSYPSSQRPIGYNAHGSNCFPGATPVTKWWDGTVTTVKIEDPKLAAGDGSSIYLLAPEAGATPGMRIK